MTTAFRLRKDAPNRPTQCTGTFKTETVKVVVVGDWGIGRTSLLITYTTGKFPPEERFPTVYDRSTDVQFNNKTISIRIFIPRVHEEYERLRPLCYIDTDVFLVCFSVTSPPSLQNVRENWIPEIRHFCPYTPAILVGCKADCRNSDQICIPLDHINQEAKSLKLKYVETSALTQYQLTYCFEVAVAIHLCLYLCA